MSAAWTANPRARRVPGDPSPDARRRPTGGVPGASRGGSVAALAAQPAERRTDTPRSPLEVVPSGYRSPRWRHRRRRFLAAGSFLAALTTVFGLVLVHVELTKNQLRLVAVQHQADLAQERYVKLRLEVAQLSAPDRVVATAQQLGMVPPATITYLTASPETGPGTAGPGTAGPGTAGPGAASTPVPGMQAAGVNPGWATTKNNSSRR